MTIEGAVADSRPETVAEAAMIEVRDQAAALAS